MGTSIDKINDLEEEKQYEADKLLLLELSEKITDINPLSQDFKDFQFLIENKDKIIRNQALINLLG